MAARRAAAACSACGGWCQGSVAARCCGRRRPRRAGLGRGFPGGVARRAASACGGRGGGLGRGRGGGDGRNGCDAAAAAAGVEAPPSCARSCGGGAKRRWDTCGMARGGAVVVSSWKGCHGFGAGLPCRARAALFWDAPGGSPCRRLLVG
ncbi:hypothetical protein PVAP13_2KG364505 [Panicum virgatum]|uniref:Uncharacterized protein n=1 Tax=Panicum virgatum TaxID=38727 RepID=A0A8T0W6K7_PANVG|nr:hypothetical protein PVAP13_2KG364505 [Panicum virgatum]